jgi:3-dehydroquinate synthase
MIGRAVIPAAGRGLRLDRPGTPKPLVDAGGQPMIVRLIGQLARAGVEQVVVVVGFEADKVSRALSRHPSINIKTKIVHNPRWEDGLARSILTAKGLVREPFLLAMADHVFDDELVSKMAALDPSADTLTALVDPRLDQVHDLVSATKVRLEGSRIEDIGTKLDEFDAVDVGLFSAGVELFYALEAAVDRDPGADLSDAVRSMCDAGKIAATAVPEGTCWDDVDTPAALIRAEMRLRKQQRERRVSRPTAQIDPKGADQFRFVVPEPVPACIAVGRGFVKEPARLPLVPEEAASSPVFVFTDETVGGLYGNDFVADLKDRGYDARAVVLPDGEESKSLANYHYLVERVLSRGVDERSVFISLGGGVVCNVCGFVASTIYRGLDLVHLPTTVMAQCDAAISHKQAINGYHGKNMVGSYYVPRLVAADVEVLATLPERLLRDGLAEVIKHAVGQDPDYVEMLLAHRGDLSDPEFLERAVRRNVELKCALAESDPKEHREAMILQYGHTVGHAVEHLTGYKLYHGESVAIGMVVAARVARLLGACNDELVELHVELCRHFGLPTEVPRNISTEDLLESLRYNKKYLTEGTRMALLADVGQLWNVEGDYAIPVSDHVLSEAVELSKEARA